MSTVTPQRRLDRGSPLAAVDNNPLLAEKWLLPFLQAESESAGAVILANEIQSVGQLRSVVIGVLDETDRCRLAAVSGIPDFDPRSAVGIKLQHALTEAARETENGTKSSPPPAPGQTSAASLHLAAQALQATAAVRIPIVTADQGKLRCWGMALLFGEPKELQSLARHPQVTAAFARVAAAGFLLQAARGSAFARNWRHLRSAVAKRWALGIAAVMLATAAVLALPVPYRIGGKCVVEPTARRIIAAPFAATLAHAHVQPGDIVTAGQLLAELDGEEVRLQIAALEAKLDQAQNRYETALAKGQAFEAQQAELEVEQFQAEMELNQRHLSQLEIRSPLAGTILSGHLRRLQGTPLTLGQNLLEIAPAGELLIEVEIPAAEISYVQSGDRVELRLDSLPGTTNTAKLEHLPPRSEMRQDRHVFVAEVPMTGDLSALRPGMSGAVVIMTKRRPLAWNLFHHAWETVLLWGGW